MPNFCLLADVWNLQTSTNYSYLTPFPSCCSSRAATAFSSALCASLISSPPSAWFLNMALYIPWQISLRTNALRTYNSIFDQHSQLKEWSLYPLKTPDWGHITAFVLISILISAQPLCWLQPQQSIWTSTRSCPEICAVHLLTYSRVVLSHTLRAWWCKILYFLHSRKLLFLLHDYITPSGHFQSLKSISQGHWSCVIISDVMTLKVLSRVLF